MNRQLHSTSSLHQTERCLKLDSKPSTWLSLSSKGLWVNGTSDSLGEIESPPENIFKKIKWYKISHDAAPKSDKEIIPTYRLIKKELPQWFPDNPH